MTTSGVLDDAMLASMAEQRRWALEALSSLGDGVLIVDERARFIFANEAATRFGSLWPVPDDGSDETGIFYPDETTRYALTDLPIVKALAGEPVHDVEIFARTGAMPRGIHLLCSGCPLRDETGRVRGAVAIFHDITVRRLQQLQLIEGERQKRAILDNIPDIAWLKDREGRFVAVNMPLVRAAGYARPEEVLGLTDYEIFPRAFAEMCRKSDAEAMQSGKPLRAEESLIGAGGDTLWYETFKGRISGESGEVLGTTGVARDITERKRAEQELLATNGELESRVALRTAELAEAQESLVRKERLAVLGQLAGGVAHQIRNPLAAIMNATYVLKRHLPPNQHQNVEDALRIIHDEVRHANVIITGLLDYARVRTPDRHPASIVEIVERALAADWPKNLRIERDIAEVPALEVDADQLCGAVSNLLRNAAEAMPEGGMLRVEVRIEGDQLMIKVTDTGPGISPQLLPHLFEPLRSTKPMGIGLGLVTARTFIEAHGGRIRHLGVPSGACFEIRLPVA